MRPSGFPDGSKILTLFAAVVRHPHVFESTSPNKKTGAEPTTSRSAKDRNVVGRDAVFRPPKADVRRGNGVFRPSSAAMHHLVIGDIQYMQIQVSSFAVFSKQNL